MRPLLRRPDSNRRPLGYEPNELPTAPLRDFLIRVQRYGLFLKKQMFCGKISILPEYLPSIPIFKYPLVVAAGMVLHQENSRLRLQRIGNVCGRPDAGRTQCTEQDKANNGLHKSKHFFTNPKACMNRQKTFFTAWNKTAAQPPRSSNGFPPTRQHG